jgi:hypothetical protein
MPLISALSINLDAPVSDLSVYFIVPLLRLIAHAFGFSVTHGYKGASLLIDGQYYNLIVSPFSGNLAAVSDIR